MSYQNAESTAPARLGRYELLGQLAVGGMAEIHLAKVTGDNLDAGFEKIVVVKRLLPELVASRAFVAMFLDEAKLVARLDHPNICEVYDLGREGAEYFLVMPYLDGVPATDLIARPRDPDRVTELCVATGVIAQACAGLHHAHELRDAEGTSLGLVHRDVSPSNLFVTASGVVKVLDFGIAKVRGAAETEVGTVKGKTQYMAPEQLLGEPLDRRCDVFALGVVLYELATHQRLFKRSSDYLAARAILEEPIPSAHEADPAIPDALAGVIARALARRPDDRPPDALALARELEAAMAPHGGLASPAQIAAALADHHADELSAQRTRQARVLATASGARPVAEAATDVVTHVSLPPDRPAWPIVLRALAMAIAGMAALVALSMVIATRFFKTSEPSTSVVEDLDAARLAVATPDAPDAPIRGANVQGSATDDVRGSADRAPDDRGSDRTPRANPPRGQGWFSIDSKPFGHVFVDDRELGVTPLVHKPIGAGRHKLKVVLRDGRSRELSITVPAGKLATPINLTW